MKTNIKKKQKTKTVKSNIKNDKKQKILTKSNKLKTKNNKLKTEINKLKKQLKNLERLETLNNNNILDDSDELILNKYKSSGNKYFNPQARLNKGQRGYCHCLMKKRYNSKTKKKENPYSFCKGLAIKKGNKYKTKLKKGQYNQYYVDFRKTNCVMNYKYDDYTIQEIQAFCQEKKIPISYINKENKKQYFKKNKLIELLINNYNKKYSYTKK